MTTILSSAYPYPAANTVHLQASKPKSSAETQADLLPAQPPPEKVQKATAAPSSATDTAPQETRSALEIRNDQSLSMQERLQGFVDTPLTEEDREYLRSLNDTLVIDDNLEISAGRPDYKGNLGGNDFIFTLGGSYHIVGYGAKSAEVALLRSGDPLDRDIQQEYQRLQVSVDLVSQAEARVEEMSKNTEGSDGSTIAMDSLRLNKESLRDALENLAYFTGQTPGMMDYMREVVYQRSAAEMEAPVDIAKLMHEYGIIDDEAPTASRKVSWGKCAWSKDASISEIPLSLMLWKCSHKLSRMDKPAQLEK